MDNEARRLEALRSYAALDKPPEPNFDRLTRMAMAITGLPMAALSVVEGDLHWLKSCQGLGESSFSGPTPFCRHTVEGGALFIVTDALRDERFAEAAIVSGARIRFYAGVPLMSPAGDCVGVLCVLDTRPHPGIDAGTLCALADLAAIAMDLIEGQARQAELAHCTQEIAHLARHDPLTGLPNRRRLNEFAETVLNGYDGVKGLALLYLDLDGFKTVNDRLGHGCGDALLRQVARRLYAEMPPNGLVARLGGDEFVVLLSGPEGKHHASFLAERLIAVIRRPYSLPEGLVQIGVSVGVAFDAGRAISLDTLLQDADLALYCAKTMGGNTVQFATDEAAPQKSVA